MGIRIILQDIRSAHNVGSIFRTADGAGVSKIYLTGYTPAPIDRFGRPQAEIQKTSLGASKTVPWESIEDTQLLIDVLKEKSYQIIAVEQCDTAKNYNDFKPTQNAVYIFGNEVEGVPEEVLEKADAIIEIPMAGKKESLNVSVAVGIILFGKGKSVFSDTL